MKAFDPDYAEWQLPVTYRALTVEEKLIPVLPLLKHGVQMDHANVMVKPIALHGANGSPGVLAASSHPTFAAAPLPHGKSEI